MPIRTQTKHKSRTMTKVRPVAWCKPEEPVCPTCGGLECLCRPRFFPGQLLAAEDLTRLDQYIKKKNQLHNRFLHGWGVVCGLEVQCHPCEDSVIITSGYALSPCGDDIVVCKPDIVDVCKLIKKCREKEREEWECRPYGNTPDCEGQDEEWVLAIRYEEHPSRGITALRSGGCGCGKPKGKCSCNGSGVVGGCGCGSLKSDQSAKPRGAPAECEPTLICEGYRYEVFRAPQQEVQKPPRESHRQRNNPILDVICNIDSPLFERICCCWEEVYDLIPVRPPEFFLPNTQFTNSDRFQWCCTVKDNVVKYFLSKPGKNCQILDQIKAIVCPDPQLDPQTFHQAFQKAVLGYGKIFVQALLDCWCSAWLPPCPEASDDPRVPLAVITIRKKDCQVMKVCNWTTLRPFAVTIPMIQYWFSWIHPLFLFQPGRPESEQFCCQGITLTDGQENPPGTAPASAEGEGGGVGSGLFSSSLRSSGVSSTTGTLSQELLKRIRRNPDPLSAELATRAFFSSQKTPIDFEVPGATDSPDFKVLEAIMGPFFSNLDANLLQAVAGPEVHKPPKQALKEEQEDVRGLRAEVQELKEALKAQDLQLKEFNQRIKKGRYR